MRKDGERVTGKSQIINRSGGGGGMIQTPQDAPEFELR